MKSRRELIINYFSYCRECNHMTKHTHYRNDDNYICNTCGTKREDHE